MAVSIAFGILYASIVIIFLVPVLIVIVDDFKRLGTGGNNKVWARAEALWWLEYKRIMYLNE